MNERIRSAMLMAKIVKYDPITMERSEELDPEKFAELIVAECIKIIYEQERVPKEYFYAKGAGQHELAIKKHFGIEECFGL